MLRLRLLVTICLTALLVATAGLAQDRGKIKKLTPTADGSTGFFSTPVADTLRQGEFSFSLSGYQVHREPGDLSLTVFPLSFTAGLSDRVEFFASFELDKRVHAPQLVGAINSRAAFNDTPFLRRLFGAGPGELRLGAKFNILSERRDNGFGLALQPIVKFSLDDGDSRRARGMTSGANDAGFDVIISKNMPGGGTFSLSSGLIFTGDPDTLNVNTAVDRQNEWNFSTGIEVPLGGSNVHFLGELAGTTFFGNRSPRFLNPKNPLDVVLGLRGFPSKWFALSGGYLGNLSQSLEANFDSTDRHGWWAQVALQRKINRPPSATCSPTQAEIVCIRQPCEGGSATINANVYDEDDDNLQINWTASGGRVSQSNGSAVFDATGLSAGSYSVKADVSDGEATASCSADITVVKDRKAPTITCQSGSHNLRPGDSVTLSAQASDANGDALTYAWQVNGQSVTNNQPSFNFGSVGRNPGNYTVQVTVTDVDGMSASCQFTVSITRPDNAPSVTLTLDQTSVYAGQLVAANASASDPDNDPLTMTWEVDGQGRPESSNLTSPYPRQGSITVNTSGMRPGSHTVKVNVRDDQNRSASDTKSFSVIGKSTIQMPLDNIGKAKLDEIALVLQQDPSLVATLTGYTDDRGSEEANERLGLRRANEARDYLVKERGIAEDRVMAKGGGEANPVADNNTEEGRKQNRRVEIELSAR